MKTIKEAAKEISFEIYKSTLTEYQQLHIGEESTTEEGVLKAIENAIKTGVEFAQRWIPVDEELPEPLVKVFVKILSVNNKEFVITAQYVPPRTVLAEDFLDPDYSDLELEDYDKENDIFYVVEGWWEHTYEADVNYMISDKVTSWRPIELK